MAEENSSPLGLQTEFNYAIDILRMMGISWRIVKVSRINEDYLSMKNALDNIRMDIQIYIPELGDKFEKEFFDKLTYVSKILSVYLNIKEQFMDKKDTSTRNAVNVITKKLKDCLEEYELLIKKVIHFKKMDMPEKEDMGMAVMED